MFYVICSVFVVTLCVTYKKLFKKLLIIKIIIKKFLTQATLLYIKLKKLLKKRVSLIENKINDNENISRFL